MAFAVTQVHYGLNVSPAEAVIAREGDTSAESSRVTFTLVNRGRRPVRITKVETTCGCTVADQLNGVSVKPEESVSFKVSAAPPHFGHKETFVVIHTDVEKDPQLRIRVLLKGQEVRPPYIDSAPREIRLEGSRGGEIVSREFEVRTIERRESAAWLEREQAIGSEFKAYWCDPPIDKKFTDDDVARTYQISDWKSRTPSSANAPSRAFLDLRGKRLAEKPFDVISVMASLVPRIRALPREVFIIIPPSGSVSENHNIAIVETPRSGNLKVSLNEVPPEGFEVGEPEYVDAPSLQHLFEYRFVWCPCRRVQTKTKTPGESSSACALATLKYRWSKSPLRSSSIRGRQKVSIM